MNNKKPWVAAVLNIIIFGAGYLYNGKRKFFGGLLLASEILSGAAYNNLDYGKFKFLLEDITSLTLVIISGLIFIVATAYDAFDEARKMNVSE